MPKSTVFLVLVLIASACRNDPSTQNTVVNPKKAASQTDTTVRSHTAISPDSLKREMSEDIDAFVKAGFYDSTELTDRVLEMYYTEKADTPWTTATVGRRYRQRMAEQDGWPARTDFDRLVKVFDLLNTKGIIALHNAGNTKDETIEDAEDIRNELKEKDIQTRGFCGYDTQDVDGAIDGAGLYLTFGDFDDNDRICTQIGTEINKALQRTGFKTTWDGTCKTCIRILPFTWQKRFGNKNCSYQHTRELLTRGTQ